MHFALMDTLSISVIGIVALVFLCRLFFKMRRDKCITVCNGCSSGGHCSTKNFAINRKVPGISKGRRINPLT
mgnify:CR=1 FL=1